MEEGFDPSYSKKTRYDGGLGPRLRARAQIFEPAGQARRSSGDGQHLLSAGAVGAALRAIRPRAGERYCAEFPATSASSSSVPADSATPKSTNNWTQVLFRRSSKTIWITWRRCARRDLVEGTSEIRNWIVTAAAADRRGNLVDYFPLYRTTTGVGCAMGFAYWDLN